MTGNTLRTACLMSIFLLFGFAAPVLAHKVVVFGWVEDGSIHVEAGFGADRPARNCPVDILDGLGEPVVSGRTDMAGKFSCPVPENKSSDLTIRLDAGTGHLGQWVLKKEEFIPLPAPSHSDPADPGPAGPGSEEQVSPEEKFRQLEAGPSWMTILAGIGIIFGLAYSAAWVRKKRKDRTR